MSSKTFSEVSEIVKDAAPEMAMQRGYPIKPLPLLITNIMTRAATKSSE